MLGGQGLCAIGGGGKGGGGRDFVSGTFPDVLLLYAEWCLD